MKSSLRILFITIVSCIVLLVSACSESSPIKDPLNYQVEPFQFKNQDRENLSLKELQGEVWIANFIFTSCDTVCPPMTAHMKQIQNMIETEGLDTKMISFSVDPEVDTPEKIKEFTKPYEISFENWSFLTGYTQNEIENFALESFKTFVQKPETGDQVAHGTSFYLVDQDGVVMKSYSGVDDPPYDQILKDIKSLENKS